MVECQYLIIRLGSSSIRGGDFMSTKVDTKLDISKILSMLSSAYSVYGYGWKLKISAKKIEYTLGYFKHNQKSVDKGNLS